MTYVCPRCRHRALVAGLCKSCVAKRQYVQVRPESEEPLAALHTIEGGDVPRLPVFGWPGVEDALFGGFVLGTVTALYGGPGVGKSTLALELADAMACLGPSGYLSSEQMVQHVKMTATRVGIGESNVVVGHHDSVEEIEQSLEAIAFRFVVVDSLQGLCSGDSSLLVPVTMRLTQAARARHLAMLLVLHMTKDDDYSGPRAVEHEVDCMLRLARTAKGVPASPSYALTVEGKYRYGPADRTAFLIQDANGRFTDARRSRDTASLDRGRGAGDSPEDEADRA